MHWKSLTLIKTKTIIEKLRSGKPLYILLKRLNPRVYTNNQSQKLLTKSTTNFDSYFHFNLTKFTNLF